MMESLPPQLLKEKLPRFLQKCAQTFETDRRYTNDMRYLRVWLQLVNQISHHCVFCFHQILCSRVIWFLVILFHYMFGLSENSGKGK